MLQGTPSMQESNDVKLHITHITRFLYDAKVLESKRNEIYCLKRETLSIAKNNDLDLQNEVNICYPKWIATINFSTQMEIENITQPFAVEISSLRKRVVVLHIRMHISSNYSSIFRYQRWANPAITKLHLVTNHYYPKHTSSLLFITNLEKYN